MGRKSKAEVRKKEILECFYEVLKEEGFENASIAKIADKMDVNPSLLIHYFKTKEEIVVAFVDFLLSRYEDSFKGDLLNSKTPQERFETLINILYGEEWFYFSEQTVFYACYYLSTRNERIRERFQMMYNRFREEVKPFAQEWLDTGVIKEGTAEDIADYLIIVNEGLTFYDKLMLDVDGYKRRSEFVRNMVVKSLTK